MLWESFHGVQIGFHNFLLKIKISFRGFIHIQNNVNIRKEKGLRGWNQWRVGPVEEGSRVILKELECGFCCDK